MLHRSVIGTFLDEDLITECIRAKEYSLKAVEDLDPLKERVGNARVVMLGEASHGTHEYYTWRAHITKRLIQEKGFNFIAMEGDWPDCYRLNRFIKGYNEGGDEARQVLTEFQRWPTWMWANWEIVALAKWLREYNQSLDRENKVGFYGLDVYSLQESMSAIMEYLEKKDPKALETAKDAFRCFEPYMDDEGRSYARALRLVPELCEAEVAAMLAEIRLRMTSYDHDTESAFSAEQNALVAVNAERYYRSLLRGGAASWNVRDSHMEETLHRLLNFHGPESKAVVWAHNTHIGDSSATDMVDVGMYNIGELARIRYGRRNVVLVGFGSYEGTVIAGREWGDWMRVMPVPPGKPGSWEALLHTAGERNKLLIMSDLASEAAFRTYIGHRAIGVVYNPDFERGNYMPSKLLDRYDAFVYIDRTQALHPIHMKPDGHQMPETYPFGM